MAIVGYARVSTGFQDTALQVDALLGIPCDRIFEEKASGTKTDRPELAAALDYCRPGDTLAVWRLDRLGRSVRHLVDVVTGLQEREVEFRSVTEGIDTSTPGGRLIFHVFAALAQFERELIVERTHAGLAAARARGRVGGRRQVMTADKLVAAQKLLDAEGTTVQAVADAIGVSRATLYRHLP